MINRFLKDLLAFLAATLCFRYIANFSVSQGVLLAVIIAFGLDLYMKRQAATQQSNFSPYRVWVQPKWEQLLRDYRLIYEANLSEQHWKELGIELSVLQPSFDESGVPKPGLIYSHDHHTFTTEMEFSITIPNTNTLDELRVPKIFFSENLRTEDNVQDKSAPSEFPWTKSVQYKVPKLSLQGERALWKELGEAPPEGALKSALNMKQQLELGLRASTDWWKQMCENRDFSELTAVETHKDSETGRTDVVLATLPLWIFDKYYRKRENNLERLRKQGELKEKQLTQNGWTIAEQNERFPVPWIRLEHKYFTVRHWAI